MASFHIRADQENRITDTQQLKDGSSAQQPAQKRVVLSTLNANARFQANRNAKQELKKQTEVFEILKDEEPDSAAVCAPPPAKEFPKPSLVEKETQETAAVKSKSNAVVKASKDLPGAVTVLPRLPLQDVKPNTEDMVVSEESVLESPMQLDKSTTPTSKGQTAMHRLLFDVDEYRDDLYDYLLEIEVLHRPKPSYMRRQPDITYAMRTILVEWLVEVAEEYKLQTETLYLAVSYIDRFLSLMSVVRSKLQLVGTAAMFIASKYEEIFAPDVNEFVYITDDTYSKRQVLRMEQLILKVLGFDMSSPTPLTFITMYCVCFNLPEKVMHLAMYLSELTLLEGDPYLQYRPSLLAASAVALARHTIGFEPWPLEMAEGSGYDLSTLMPCLAELNGTHARAPNIPQQAVREKYSSSKWNSVSTIPNFPIEITASESS